MSNSDPLGLTRPERRSNTATLDALATQLYGEEWPLKVSELTGISSRTCQRVKAAALAGNNDTRAAGVLNRFRRVLTEMALEADPSRFDLEDAIDHMPPSEDYWLRQAVVKMSWNGVEDLGTPRGPYRLAALDHFLQAAAARELSLVNLLKANIAITQMPDDTLDTATILIDALDGGLDDLNALIGVRPDNSWQLLKDVEPVFTTPDPLETQPNLGPWAGRADPGSVIVVACYSMENALASIPWLKEIDGVSVRGPFISLLGRDLYQDEVAMVVTCNGQKHHLVWDKIEAHLGAMEAPHGRLAHLLEA